MWRSAPLAALLLVTCAGCGASSSSGGAGAQTCGGDAFYGSCDSGNGLPDAGDAEPTDALAVADDQGTRGADSYADAGADSTLSDGAPAALSSDGSIETDSACYGWCDCGEAGWCFIDNALQKAADVGQGQCLPTCPANASLILVRTDGNCPVNTTACYDTNPAVDGVDADEGIACLELSKADAGAKQPSCPSSQVLDEPCGLCVPPSGSSVVGSGPGGVVPVIACGCPETQFIDFSCQVGQIACVVGSVSPTYVCEWPDAPSTP